MKRILRSITATLAVLAAGAAGLASAETVISVTQVSYDNALRPQCTAVRMNPDAYGSLPSDACTVGAAGSYGPDRITKAVYDAAGQVREVFQAWGTSDQRMYSAFSYSADGKVVDSVDANGNRSHNVYDGFDRLITYYYPSTTRPTAFDTSTADNAISTAGSYDSGNYEAYGYDANGNKTTWRRRDGRYVYYNYDNLNREILSYVSDSSVANLYTDYDLQGHICAKVFTTDIHAQGPDCTSLFDSLTVAGVHYKYDGLGRVLASKDMNGRSLSYAYNQASARTMMWYPDSNSVGYTLDNLNRVTNIGFDAYAGLTSQTYDSLGRLVAIGKNGGSTSYGYDALGRLTNMTNDLNGTSNDVSWSFTYNAAGQVMTQSASSTLYDYTETSSTSVSKTYDGLNRDSTLVSTSTACPSGGYDARGNLVCDGRQFDYDIYNRLLGAANTGTDNLTLVYDPEGRLSSYTSGSTVTQFLYDGVDLIGEYDSSGNVLRRYIHGTATDDPLAWYEGSSTSDLRYIYTNYQGSVIAYADSSGYLEQHYKYGPYGEPENGSNAESWSGFRFRYTGQLILPEAKLYYYKARVYDPIAGRFLQTDPIGTKDDLDLYAYTGDDPINHSDPAGLESGSVSYNSISQMPVQTTVSGFRAVMNWLNTVIAENVELQTCSFAACAAEQAAGQLPKGDITRGDLINIGLSMADGIGVLAKSAEVAGSIRGINTIRGNMNCVNCAIATDATLAGRPASALGGGPFPLTVLEEHFGSKFGRLTSIDRITTSMSKAGSGARGIVYGEPIKGDVGHVFNVVNQDGVVRFLDGQTGKAADLSGYKNFSLMRTNQ